MNNLREIHAKDGSPIDNKEQDKPSILFGFKGMLSDNPDRSQVRPPKKKPEKKEDRVTTVKQRDDEKIARLFKGTDNKERQVRVVNAIKSGFSTTSIMNPYLGDMPLARVKLYVQRLFLEGKLERVRVKPGGAFVYSVTDKGIAFVGGKS